MGRGAEGGEKAGLESSFAGGLQTGRPQLRKRRDSCKAVAGPAGMTETGSSCRGTMISGWAFVPAKC